MLNHFYFDEVLSDLRCCCVQLKYNKENSKAVYCSNGKEPDSMFGKFLKVFTLQQMFNPCKWLCLHAVDVRVRVFINVSETFGITRLHGWVVRVTPAFESFKRQRADVLTPVGIISACYFLASIKHTIVLMSFTTGIRQLVSSTLCAFVPRLATIDDSGLSHLPDRPDRLNLDGSDWAGSADCIISLGPRHTAPFIW